MNDTMFAELVESIKQAGHISRMRKMSASEGRALDWSKAQKVIFPNLKASTDPSPIFVAAAQKFGKRTRPTGA